MNKTSTAAGNDLNLSGLQTKKTGKDESYNLWVKATDALGAFSTKSRKLNALKPDEPPEFTSLSIPSSMGWRGSLRVQGSAQDPDGDDNKIDWAVFSSGSHVSGKRDLHLKDRASINGPTRKIPEVVTVT